MYSNVYVTNRFRQQLPISEYLSLPPLGRSAFARGQLPKIRPTDPGTARRARQIMDEIWDLRNKLREKEVELEKYDIDQEILNSWLECDPLDTDPLHDLT